MTLNMVYFCNEYLCRTQSAKDLTVELSSKLSSTEIRYFSRTVRLRGRQRRVSANKRMTRGQTGAMLAMCGSHF